MTPRPRVAVCCARTIDVVRAPPASESEAIEPELREFVKLAVNLDRADALLGDELVAELRFNDWSLTAGPVNSVPSC